MQPTSQRFGGDWTEKKLDALKKYLEAYLKVFRKQAWCTTMYIDAFAGTGYREVRLKKMPTSGTLFGDSFLAKDEDAIKYLDGSASIALQLSPGFKEHYFIELDPKKCQELKDLAARHPDKSASVACHQSDANVFIKSLCGRSVQFWNPRRAVLFLDPFGMNVEWPTLEAVAKTGKIDTWILFPSGSGVSRLLERSGNIPEGWAERLTLMFGTEEWRTAFYEKRKRTTLFGDDESIVRNASPDAIGEFYIKRLATIFPQYVDQPMVLRNSKNSPMFMLCFAAGNAGEGGKTAVRIAKHIIKG